MFSNADLRKLILPLVVEQSLVFAVGIADSMMVSYAGEAAMSGVSLVDMFTFLVNTVLAAVGTGGAVIVAQYIGNKDRERASLSASQLMTLAAVVSIFVMAFSLVFRHGIMTLFYGNIEEDVRQAALTYLLITALSYPFLGVYNAGAALFRSMGKTSKTMQVSMIMNLINVVGNFIGIFILKAGVVGVAVPTLLGRMFACFAMSYMAFNKENQVYVEWKSILQWNTEFVRRLAKIAIPNGIENGFFAMGKLLVTSIVSLFGTHQIAASAASLSVGTIAIIFCSANNLAMGTVIGQCVGAEEYDQAAYYTKKIMKVSYLGNITMTILMAVFLNQILGLYSLSEEAFRYCAILVTIHNVGSCFIHPSSFNLANALRATGDAKFTMYVGAISMIFFRVGVAWLFGIVLNFQIIGVWIAMMADWAFRSLCFSLRFRSGKWKNYRAI